MAIHILYPEDRWISEETVISWAQDSYVNNADWLACSKCGKSLTAPGYSVNACECGEENDYDYEPVYDGSNPPQRPATLQESMDWLTDTGEITFARK